MMGRRDTKMNTADELDVLTKWRRMYCYTKRPGVCARVKRNFRRRERVTAKSRLRREEW